MSLYLGLWEMILFIQKTKVVDCGQLGKDLHEQEYLFSFLFNYFWNTKLPIFKIEITYWS